ncbi:phage portal protein [Sporosarcina sp. P37]|uniref:phage portal protein n=1 Tax=unclassified Sporosarcina TaxID=2647733 RepID=UPI000A17DD28|nr:MULTISPECIES: phage portal protein [unclassified Sporosarcina]ARK23579.1 phage portal protein [Sporosarcina sp. P37]
MGVFDWARAFFNKGTRTINLDDCHFMLQAEVYYKRLAIETCIDLIANALARCEFQTYEKGKATRKELHYLLNVQPNQNQNATQFFHKAIRNFFLDGECLIINDGGEKYLIADDFERLEFVFKPNIYKNIIIGDLQMDRTYSEKEVFYLRLTDANIIKLIDDLYASYGKLLASSMAYYKRKNTKRLMFKGDFLRRQDDEIQAALDDMRDAQMKNWFDPDVSGATFDLQEGYEMEDMSDSKVGAQGQSDSRDISNLIDDIFNYVAMAFHVPRGLLKGDLADIEKQTDNFIMFALSTPAEMISDEFNRKLYTRQDHINRTYLKLDTSKIKTIDISQLAVAVDKLFSIGGMTINDVLEALGKDPIDDDVANKRYVTKNYERVDVAEQNLKGGENE